VTLEKVEKGVTPGVANANPLSREIASKILRRMVSECFGHGQYLIHKKAKPRTLYPREEPAKV
jgi:hypothetical protein